MSSRPIYAFVVAMATLALLADPATSANNDDASGTCRKLTVCPPGSVEIKAPTATSDRECGDVGDVGTYQFEAYLDEDENVHLRWDVDLEQKVIHFAYSVRTTGWIGLGFSPSGSMRGADIVVAWIDNGVVNMTDRHATDLAKPIIDDHSDYTLIGAREEGGATIIELTRPLATCDDQDYEIKMGTTRTIWAFGTEDPATEDDFTYHGTQNRGSKSINFLTARSTRVPADLPSARTVDLIVDDILLPAQRTEYYCKVFRLPDVSKKHHIISWEPIVQAENLGRVHHILIYQCNEDLSGSDRTFERTCHGNMPGAVNRCRGSSPIVTWAIGQDQVVLPEEAGLPMGPDEGQARYVLMETHYDNPNRVEFRDSSGIRIHYTETPRPHDAAILQIGHDVSDDMVIPPGTEEFFIKSYCPGHCTSLLPYSITVAGVFLHAHLAGVGMRVRHVRDGVELPPIGDNPTYDFNFQTMDILPEPITIQAGDDIIAECRYRTDDEHVAYLKELGFEDATHNIQKVVGGEDTNDEMCLAYAFYFPKLTAIDRCWSGKYLTPDDKELIGTDGAWTDQQIKEWQDSINNGVYSLPCQPNPLFERPEIRVPLPPPDNGCNVTISTTPAPACEDDDDTLNDICIQDFGNQPCSCEEMKGFCGVYEESGEAGVVVRNYCPRTCERCPDQTRQCVDDNAAASAVCQLLYGVPCACQDIANGGGCSPSAGGTIYGAAHFVCPQTCGASCATDRRRDASAGQCAADEYFDASTAPSEDDDDSDSGLTTGVIAGVFVGAFVGGILLAYAFFAIMSPDGGRARFSKVDDTNSYTGSSSDTNALTTVQNEAFAPNDYE